MQLGIKDLSASLPLHKVVTSVPEALYEYYGEYTDDEIELYEFVNQPYSE